MDEEVVLLYDSKNVDLSKNILFISDLYNLNPNSKKVLTANYSYVENLTKTSNSLNKLIDINAEILNLLNDLSFEFNNCVSFNDQITISELLNIYEFKFDFEDKDFIKTFITYLKAIKNSNNYKIVITTNLQDLIEPEEFDFLIEELGYLNLTLINISSIKSELNYSKTVIIDKDLCEI